MSLPFRTRNTTVDVYGELSSPYSPIQPPSISPASSIAVISCANASVTTSASFPSITERACEPEPPWDCVTFTSCPLFSFQ